MYRLPFDTWVDVKRDDTEETEDEELFALLSLEFGVVLLSLLLSSSGNANGVGIN